MKDFTGNKKTQEGFTDPLSELIRNGARELIAQAVEAELQSLLVKHQSVKLVDGRQAVVRNGYLPQRSIQTGIGDVEVQVPKVKDRSGQGIKFNSALVPPYLRKTMSIENLLPWLYLKGISTGDFEEALHALLGEKARGLSAKTISRLKDQWQEEYAAWARRDLSQKNYVYVWADGVYCGVRMDDRLCLLVIIGVTEQGDKEVVAIEDGYRESTDSWEQVLTDLRQRGLTIDPKLAVGDGALGFWKALHKVYPATRHQRCWVHKTANVLSKLPKVMQPKIKQALHEIWMAPTRDQAHKAFDHAVETFGAKYPNAMACLVKDREELLAFYDFPAQHWSHLRTTNPIESTFATVRLRTAKTRNCGSRRTTLAMVFKLMQSASKRWIKLSGFHFLTLVVNNVKFKDGIEMKHDQLRNAA